MFTETTSTTRSHLVAILPTFYPSFPLETSPPGNDYFVLTQRSRAKNRLHDLLWRRCLLILPTRPPPSCSLPARDSRMASMRPQINVNIWLPLEGNVTYIGDGSNPRYRRLGSQASGNVDTVVVFESISFLNASKSFCFFVDIRKGQLSGSSTETHLLGVTLVAFLGQTSNSPYANQTQQHCV